MRSLDAILTVMGSNWRSLNRSLAWCNLHLKRTLKLLVESMVVEMDKRGSIETNLEDFVKYPGQR